MKAGTVFNWHHKDPENAGLWEVLEDMHSDRGGFFTASFLAKNVETGEESYIGPDASEITVIKCQSDENP